MNNLRGKNQNQNQLKIKIEQILKPYTKILENKSLPKFLLLKSKKNQNGSFHLQERVKKGYEILKNCQLCERNCYVNRIEGEEGFCRNSNKIEISSAFGHTGEEPFLIPSYTIFFMGCNFRCQFCQNYEISQKMEKGSVYDVEELSLLIEKGSRNCKNVNFVGGECTPFLPYILDSLQNVTKKIPTIWNSNFYFSVQAQELLKDLIDLYLSDWKYGPGNCADRLSNAPYQGSTPFNYWEIVKRNHDFAFKDAILVIRHLIMPNHVECCSKPILEYIAKNYGDKCIINLMAQYRPSYNAYNFEDISRSCTRKELNEVWNYAEKLGVCVVICYLIFVDLALLDKIIM